MTGYDTVLLKGGTVLKKELAGIYENSSNELCDYFRQLLRRQQNRLMELDEELDGYDQQLKQKVKQDV
ncbi:hypothetical protein [Marinomonas sp. 2405UD68-3]|uniref:hypothetical protein n=1 Tax=Marinomonas sp. 2405UD68-3 TaxID=3391835 RepID=UPI0039C96260